MDLSRAVQLVALDQKDGDDILSVADAIEHALDTLRLPGTLHVPGSWEIEGDDEVAQAYIAVLRTFRPTADLRASAELLAEHAGQEFIDEYARGQQR